MKTRKDVDYLQFTYPTIPSWLNELPYPETSFIPFYKQVYRLECGTFIHFGNPNSEKYLVQMPGAACSYHDMTTNKKRLSSVFERDCAYSRVDLAITVNERTPLDRFILALRNDEVMSSKWDIDGATIIADKDGNPETVYVGNLKKRSKKGVFRAYDKCIQLGLESPLVRFEIELRGRQANTTIKRLVAGADIGQIMRQLINIPGASWWNEVISATDAALPAIPPGAPTHSLIERRWRWLDTQVAPALGRLLYMDAGNAEGNLARFLRRVEQERHRAILLDTRDESH